MKVKLLFCVLALSLTLSLCVPTSFFSTKDKESSINSVKSQQKKDGTFNGLKNTYFAVSSLIQLGSDVSQVDKVCAYVKSEAKSKENEVESIFYATYVTETLGCGENVSPKVQETLESALKSTKAIEIAYALASIHYLNQKKHVSINNDAVNAGVKKLIGTADDEGLIGGKVFTTGFSLGALSFFPKVDSEGLNNLFTSSLEVISQADTTSNADNLEFSKEEVASNSVSGLRVTSTYFSGIINLASALGKKSTLKADQIAQITESFLLHRQSSSLEDIFAVSQGLKAAKSSVPSPLVISLVDPSLSLSAKDGSVKVKVTDVFGNFASKSKVVLVKATSDDDKKTVLINNQDVASIQNDQTGYSFNFLNSKPESGFYKLEFRATPDDAAAYLPAKGLQTLKVISSIAIEDFQVVVSDSMDSKDIADGKKYTTQYPKEISTKITAEFVQHLSATFKIKNQATNNFIAPHQVFVVISKGSEEAIVPATNDGKQFKVSVTVEELSSKFRGESGDYTLTLTIGDPFIANSFVWKFGTVQINFPNKSKNSNPILYQAKPEIVHQFRQPEKRPAKTFSFAFTIATLAPFLFLFIGFIRVGANLRNFPTGGGFIWAVGFQICLGAILALFALYWLQLNMMNTLFYLGGLSIPTLFFAQKCLTYLAAQKVKTA